MASRIHSLASVVVALFVGSPTVAQQILPPGQIDASGNLKFGPVIIGKRQGTTFTSTPDVAVIPGAPSNPIAVYVSKSGACDQLAGKFVPNWNTNNYLPDCSGIFQGDQVPYAATRGANNIANVTPKQLDRGHVENARMLIQHVTPGRTNEGAFVINHLNMAGQKNTPGAPAPGVDWATTAFGISQFVSPHPNGIDKPSKNWGFNFDAWYAPNSGKILQVGAEWDYNSHNNSCGYDEADRTGCYQVGQWHSYFSSHSRDIDVRVSPIVGPAYFGHATVSGNTLTAIDWEMTQEGNAGPFSKGMFYVWLYPGTGLQTGEPTFYRTSCSDTKTCTLEAPPAAGTYGFQHNPTQVSIGFQMDLGGNLVDADPNKGGRIIRPNLTGEANLRFLDNAVRGIVIGGRQKYGIDTTGALGMTYVLQAAPRQNLCLSGNIGCFEGQPSGAVYSPPLAFVGTRNEPAVLDFSLANIANTALNLAAGQKLCYANGASCFRGDTNAGSPYVLVPPMAWTGGQPAALLDSTSATINGNVFAALGSTHQIRGGLLAPQQFAKAQLPTCNGPLLGARVTVIDIQGTPTWGQAYSALSGGGAGVAAQPAFCDGGVQGWVAK